MISIQEYDLGINYNGTPLDDVTENAIVDIIMDTIDTELRVPKNYRYKIIIYQLEDEEEAQDE